MTVIRKYHEGGCSECLVTKPLVIADGKESRVIIPATDPDVVYVNPAEWKGGPRATLHLSGPIDIVDPTTGEIVL